MQRTHRPASRARQFGRAGPIMALVSILIIAALAKVTLAQFGLTPQKDTPVKAANGKAVAAIVPELEDDDEDAASPPKSKPNARPAQAVSSIDKARSVQGVIDGMAAKTESQIESESK